MYQVLKRTFALVIMVTLIVTNLNITVVNASNKDGNKEGVLEEKSIMNNLLTSDWEPVFGLNKIEIFQVRNNFYIGNFLNGMQQIISLEQYQDDIDKGKIYCGFGLEVLSKYEANITINIDFYEEKPNEENYDQVRMLQALAKKVSISKEMNTLSFNKHEYELVGIQDKSYVVPVGTRYARISIIANSKDYDPFTFEEQELRIHNIHFGLSYNNRIQSDLTKEGSIELEEDNSNIVCENVDNKTEGNKIEDEHVLIQNLTEGWAPVATLDIDIISDEVKEMLLPNGLITYEDFTYYVTKNGTYTFKIILNNNQERYKHLTVDYIDTEEPYTEILVGEKSIEILAYDNQSGVESVYYAWSKKEIFPMKYEELMTKSIHMIDSPGSWYLHVKVVDKAGNVNLLCSDNITIQEQKEINRECKTNYEY